MSNQPLIFIFFSILYISFINFPLAKRLLGQKQIYSSDFHVASKLIVINVSSLSSLRVRIIRRSTSTLVAAIVCPYRCTCCLTGWYSALLSYPRRRLLFPARAIIFQLRYELQHSGNSFPSYQIFSILRLKIVRTEHLSSFCKIDGIKKKKKEKLISIPEH